MCFFVHPLGPYYCQVLFRLTADYKSECFRVFFLVFLGGILFSDFAMVDLSLEPLIWLLPLDCSILFCLNSHPVPEGVLIVCNV